MPVLMRLSAATCGADTGVGRTKVEPSAGRGPVRARLQGRPLSPDCENDFSFLANANGPGRRPALTRRAGVARHDAMAALKSTSVS